MTERENAFRVPASSPDFARTDPAWAAEALRQLGISWRDEADLDAICDVFDEYRRLADVIDSAQISPEQPPMVDLERPTR
ncbi:MAG TPA: hypothetical protein VFC51_17005 [Chloroflexota bacterium]|nr:hypothetical protein [Chloroflexota bacterium]